MVKNYISAKEQVQIDECYCCGAKFFDQGELEKMREEFSTEQDRKQDFLSKNYDEIGAKIDELELEHQMHLNTRSKFLKILDKVFLKRN